MGLIVARQLSGFIDFRDRIIRGRARGDGQRGLLAIVLVPAANQPRVLPRVLRVGQNRVGVGFGNEGIGANFCGGRVSGGEEGENEQG